MKIWREKRRGGIVGAIGEEGGARRRQRMKEAKGDGERGGRGVREKRQEERWREKEWKDLGGR